MACEPWTIDPVCLPPGFEPDPEDWTPEQIAAFEQAQALLNRLTHGMFSLCEVIIRPCRRRCAENQGYTLGGRGWFGPTLAGGQVYNTCGGACYEACACGPLCEVLLPGPVYDILEVIVDGVVIDPDGYRLDGGGRLVRLGGLCWPDCQDLSLPDTEVGTFSVRYRRGALLDAAGRRAFTVFMVELWLACTANAACRLPARVTNVVREGVTYTLLDNLDFLNDGRTGLPEVDAWLAAFNPYGTRSPMQVWSPDLVRPRTNAVPVVLP